MRDVTAMPIPTSRVDPSALTALAVAAVGAATLGGAWFFQYVLNYLPCPLCLEERIPYYVSIPLAAALFFAACAQVPRAWLAGGFAVIAAAMLWNMGLSTYHAGVEWHLWAGPSDCSGPLTPLKSGGSLLSQLQKIHIPRCDEPAWTLFGISLAGYNAVISLMLAGFALLGAYFAIRRAAIGAGQGAINGAR